MQPSKLFPLLAAPGTDQPLALKVTRWGAAGEPFEGWAEDGAGSVVARLDRFRFDFVAPRPVTAAEREAVPHEARTPVARKTAPTDERIVWQGETVLAASYLKGFHGDDASAHFHLTSCAPALELALHSHAWSGICRVLADGEQVAEVDLFHPSTSVIRRVRVENPSGALRRISVHPTGRAHPRAQGRQVLLEYVLEETAESESPVYAKHPARNRGGAFAPRFFELLSALPAEAVVLDVGGGRRQIDDPRYINLEYAPYEEPDLLGDGTRLPFRDGSVDLVYTAAVLEHVPDPLAMGREIHRVLKPGGQVLANSAFMQPVHSEGQHFFNLTPYGIELTFSRFEDRQVWWDGGFADLMKWIVDLSHVQGSVGPQKVEQFLALAREFQHHITPDRLMYFAGGVWLEGRKAGL